MQLLKEGIEDRPTLSKWLRGTYSANLCYPLSSGAFLVKAGNAEWDYSL